MGTLYTGSKHTWCIWRWHINGTLHNIPQANNTVYVKTLFTGELHDTYRLNAYNTWVNASHYYCIVYVPTEITLVCEDTLTTRHCDCGMHTHGQDLHTQTHTQRHTQTHTRTYTWLTHTYTHTHVHKIQYRSATEAIQTLPYTT